ncbi:hypothetical protein F4780DRAFT_14660 [Xylariomycetidae sp. FL0641]|nr:hypothetical protein F4780DRAFT_14660 [Xylariomycetidae sp. FL0641]
MLKSTYKPSPGIAPLPPGWTEHKAPTGHTYYYNAATQESTYQRPGVQPTVAAPPPPPAFPSAQLSDPAAANAFLAQYDPARQRHNNSLPHHGRGGHRGPGDRRDRPRPQPVDKPKSKVAIPGCEPWLLVYTKYGRRFAYNPVKNASYWRIPEKIMQGVLELDINGIKEKQQGSKEGATEEPEATGSAEPTAEASGAHAQREPSPELGSDEEEVEVTDDEDEERAEGDAEGDVDGQHPSKRQRTDEAPDDMPVEFNEDDIAYQLQAMGQDYGLDPGEYDDGNADEWPEGAEGLQITDEEARELFKDLLDDYHINPYSPWEKLIEEGKVVEDARYTVLNTMKARKEVWEEWSRSRIQALKEQRAKQEKKDPRIPYLAFLHEKANPKLYWQEFRRKWKKEPVMRDTSLTDKEREKWYREHVARLRLPQDRLKKDLTALLREVPLRLLNNKTPPENLPSQILADIRWIGLDASVRGPLVAAYIQTLDPPPEAGGTDAEEDEATRKAREDRRRREAALAERERVAAEERRRQERQLQHGKAILREEEREIEQAMRVGKKGLQGQLAAARETMGGS